MRDAWKAERSCLIYDLQRKSFLRGFTYVKQGALRADQVYEMTVEQDYNFDGLGGPRLVTMHGRLDGVLMDAIIVLPGCGLCDALHNPLRVQPRRTLPQHEPFVHEQTGEAAVDSYRTAGPHRV